MDGWVKGRPDTITMAPLLLLQAVMLSHDNLTWAGKMIEYHFEDRRDSDTLVSYLPLSHIAAQVKKNAVRPP